MEHSSPWLNESNWCNNQIRPKIPSSHWISWATTLIWISVAIPLALLEHPPEYEILAIFINITLLLISLRVLSTSIRNIVQWHNFGRPELHLSPFPGSIGGDVAGSIQLKKPLPNGTRFEIELINRSTHKSATSLHIATGMIHSTVWQQRQLVFVEAENNGSQINFKFEVPESCLESLTDNKHLHYNSWQLKIKSVTTTKFERDYLIPVYALDKPLKSAIKVETIDESLEDEPNITVSPDGTTLGIEYPLFRQRRITEIMLAISAILIGFGSHVISISSGDVVAQLLFGFAPCLLGLPILLDGLYRLGCNYRITVNTDGITLEKHLLFFQRRQFISPSEIDDFRIERSRLMELFNIDKGFYKIKLINQPSAETIIGDMLRDTKQAEQRIELIKKALAGKTIEFTDSQKK